METIQEEIPNIVDSLPKDPLTQTIRAKYQALKSKSLPPFNLIRHYQTNNEEKYKNLLEEFRELTNEMSQGNEPDLSKFNTLIFGALEGSSGQQQIDRVLRKRLGITVPSTQLLQQLVKGKIKTVIYGIDKKKFTNIREVCNKETFESMSQLFDLKQIKNHRKICSSIKNYLKSMKKFKDLIQNSGSVHIFAETSEQNDSYINFVKQQISFNKMKIPGEILGIDSQDMGDQLIQEKAPVQIKLTFHNGTPNKKGILSFMKDQTASGLKVDEAKQEEAKPTCISNSSEQVLAKLKQDDRENKNATKNRRTKQEVERQKQAREKERLAKLEEKKKKQEQKLKKEHQRLKQKLEKQYQKEQEREAKQKQKEAKELERINKEKQRENQRLARQAAKQAERIAKEKKNNPGQTLAKWFKPAEASSPCKNEKIETFEENIIQSNEEDRDLAKIINENKISISQLRDSFLSDKMQVQSICFEPYYSTVYTYKSRLEFNRFLVNEQRFKEYIQPHDEYASGKYQDSSVEYEDFCGDCCDDEMSLEQEEQSYNSAIVPDSYVSEDQLSSLNESKDRINIKIDRGAEWSFSGNNNYTAQRYIMFCCYQDEAYPLPLSEPEETNQISINLKIDLYKQIHGSYGAKDQLIKRLANIADKVPKSYLDNLIKETTTKRGNQRLVKPQIIDFLTQQRQTFAKDLEDIKAKRDEQNALQMKGKINEKQKEMERLILEEAGTYYIIDLLHFLREKGYRLRKRDLTEFIKARVGSQWDDVRKRMEKMQLKEKQKINQFLSKKDKDALQKSDNNKKSTAKQGKSKQEKIDDEEEENINKQEQDQKKEVSSQSQKNEKMEPEN